MSETLNLGTDPTNFLKRYWQKKPHLMRAAFANFVCPISANELAGIACETGSAARLITGKGRSFSVESGPFTAQRFTKLSKTNWTLLVQEVDQWDAGVRAVLKHFDFLPRWRIEDVMVSYAVTGGSVGAHVDQYDVFLLQARGQRTWQIDDRAQAKTPEFQKFLPKAKLKLLEKFEPNRSWVLNPGDMLYLPPGVPHHGTSLDDDCMTFSVGLRAPSALELLENFAQTCAQNLADTLRFSDTALENHQGRSEKLDLASVRRARHALTQALKLSDAEMGSWFATFMSGYRSSRIMPLVAPMRRPVSQKNADTLEKRLALGAVLTLAPGIRVVEWQGVLHIGGQKIPGTETPGIDTLGRGSKVGRLGRHLNAFSVHIDLGIWQRLDDPERAIVHQLKRAGALIWGKRPPQTL
jgi:50S ribosomal protein L16 3-hydroxylase